MLLKLNKQQVITNVINAIINIFQHIKVYYLQYTMEEQDIWNVINVMKKVGIKKSWLNNKLQVYDYEIMSDPYIEMNEMVDNKRLIGLSEEVIELLGEPIYKYIGIDNNQNYTCSAGITSKKKQP